MIKKLLLLSLSAISVMLCGAENLIPNPELKLVPGSVMPKFWHASGNSAAQVLDLPNGKKGFELTTSTDGKRSHVLTYIKLEPAVNYRMSATVQGDAGTKGRIYIETSAPWQTYGSEIFVCSGKPQQIEFEFKFKPYQRTPYMALRLDTPGKIVFSDLKMEKQPESLIKDPKFTNLKNWNAQNKAQLKVVNDSEKGAALLIKATSAPKALAIQYGVPVAAGVGYIFTVDVKGKPGASASAYIECNKPWATFSAKKVSCNGQWQTMSIEFTYKSLQNKPYLVLRVNEPNTEVLFANPRIVPAPGKFSNGDFNGGAAQWEVKNGSVVDSKSTQGQVLQLQNFSGTASAVQKGIAVKKGQAYRITYMVRGGNDKRYTDAQNATWFRVAARMDGKYLSGSDQWHDVFTAWHNKSLTFMPEKDGNIEIVCELRDPGTVQFDNIELVETNAMAKPLEIVIGMPYGFRETAILGSSAPIEGSIVSSVSGIARKEVTFNGKTAAFSGNAFSLPVPQKEGKYPLTVTVFDKNGKKLASTAIEFTVRKPGNRKITFTKERVMLIDDMPFFPLGVWSVRGNKSFSEKMRIVAENGFNCARIDGDNIDDAADHGLLALVHVAESTPKFRDAKHRENWIKNYRAGLLEIQNHPSLIAYYNSDEPAWRGVKPEPMIDAYNVIRAIDPDRPIFLNEAPRGKIEDIRIYTDASDIYGVDIYPVPSPNPHSGIADKYMTSVGKYTDICREVVRDTQPVWMTLQSFAWGALTKRERIYPTTEENRFMAYNAIAHGATGLFYWGTNWGYENWEEFAKLGITIKELRSMTSVLVAPTVKPAGFSTGNSDINILHKQVNGKNYYIVLNEGPKDCRVTFSGKMPAKLYVLTENRTITPAKGEFTDNFKPYSVHVYSETPQPPAPLPDFPTRRMTPKVDLGDTFTKANWIWYPKYHNTKDHRALFFREFELNEMPVKAEIFATGDDYFRLWFNGELKIEHFENRRGYATLSLADVTKFVKKGKNILAVKAMDGGGAPCAMLFAIRLVMADGSEKVIVSDADTMSCDKIPAAWPVKSIDGNWVKSEVIGKYGIAPWGGNGRVKLADDKFNDYFPF